MIVIPQKPYITSSRLNLKKRLVCSLAFLSQNTVMLKLFSLYIIKYVYKMYYSALSVFECKIRARDFKVCQFHFPGTTSSSQKTPGANATAVITARFMVLIIRQLIWMCIRHASGNCLETLLFLCEKALF